jgi:hypothetical protein
MDDMRHIAATERCHVVLGNEDHLCAAKSCGVTSDSKRGRRDTERGELDMVNSANLSGDCSPGATRSQCYALGWCWNGLHAWVPIFLSVVCPLTEK